VGREPTLFEFRVREGLTLGNDLRRGKCLSKPNSLQEDVLQIPPTRRSRAADGSSAVLGVIGF